MMNIGRLMAGLAEKREVFHSEADFQHALAWHIHKEMPETEVRLELPFTALGVHSDKREHLDIWLPKEGVAIELKYVTRKLKEEKNGEHFKLSEQSAQDTRRYDFLKDMQRLEGLCSKLEECKEGHAVLLTNDPLLWKKPQRPNPNDRAFRVHDGNEVSGTRAWKGEPSEGTTKGRKCPIELKGCYRFCWNEYSHFGEEKQNGRFRYLAVSVV